jgi:ribonuclease HI
MIKIEIYTDGACNQKARDGGWSFVMLENGKEKLESSGSVSDTTNNQCEMLAVIHAFEAIEEIEFFENTEIHVYSDSAYVVNAFLDDWISNWIDTGWKNSYGKPVANKNLWEQLIHFQKKHKPIFTKITRRSTDLAKKVDEMAGKMVGKKS